MNHADCEVRLRIAQAQRDEALAEAERLRNVGFYLVGALHFYVPDLTRDGRRHDPFYADARAALNAWQAATEENNHA